MRPGFLLITGATGFVGRHLCPELQKAGYRIRAVHIEPSPPAGWPDRIEWLQLGGIGSHTDWTQAFDGGVTHVVHLAALAHRIAAKDQVSDGEYDEVNYLGTAQLARAARQASSVRRFVFVSSIGAVTTLSEEPVNESTPCNPTNAYGRSKLAAETAIENTFRGTETGWCCLRPPLLYGPGNPGNMKRLLKLLETGLPLPLGSVRNRRTFLYVGNLVSAVLTALQHPGAARKVFCLADGEVLSTPELLRGLGQAAGRPVRLFPFPMPGLALLGKLGSLVVRLTGRSAGFDSEAVERLCGSLEVDASQFRNCCGWQPPFSVSTGLRQTVRPASGAKI